MHDEDEFVSSSGLEKCINASLAHHWIPCSEWVPSEWESKQLIKTSQLGIMDLYFDQKAKMP